MNLTEDVGLDEEDTISLGDVENSHQRCIPNFGVYNSPFKREDGPLNIKISDKTGSKPCIEYSKRGTFDRRLTTLSLVQKNWKPELFRKDKGYYIFANTGDHNKNVSISPLDGATSSIDNTSESKFDNIYNAKAGANTKNYEAYGAIQVDLGRESKNDLFFAINTSSSASTKNKSMGEI